MTKIEKTIIDWANDVFGFDVIWADQAGPRPAKPYATLHWFGDRDIGMGHLLHTGLATDILEQVQQLRRLTIQIEVYAGPANETATPEALELLEGALLTLQGERVARQFREAGIAFSDHETILRMDEQEGDRWERRAISDVHFFHFLTNDNESVGRIDTAVPTITTSP